MEKLSLAEILAKLRWIWIEQGGKVATVIITIAFAVLLLRGLSQSGRNGGGRTD